MAIQDQTGNTPRRWSKTGKVVEVLGHDSYLIKVHGSNRITKRNRQFLKKLLPYKCDVDDYVSPVSVSHIPSEKTLQSDAPDPLEDSCEQLVCETPTRTDIITPDGSSTTGRHDSTSPPLDSGDQSIQLINDEKLCDPILQADRSHMAVRSPPVKSVSQQNGDGIPDQQLSDMPLVSVESNSGGPSSTQYENGVPGRRLTTIHSKVREKWVVNPKYVKPTT